MDDTLSEAIKEAYASPRSSEIIYETIEIAHEDLPASFFMVNDKVPLVAQLEDTTEVTFNPIGFEFKQPSSNDGGVSELTLVIDNVDRRASDTAMALVNSRTPPMVKFRQYVANDLTTPANDPPLILFLKDVKITPFAVSARATFLDLLNKPFLHILYRRRTFPSLGN